MNSEDILLTDGSVLNIKINYFTIHLMQKENLEKFNKKKLSKDEQLEVSAKMLYVILRSNGRKDVLDHEDAMMLIPLDDETIQKIMDDFKTEIENYKKKQESKKNMKKMVSNK